MQGTPNIFPVIRYDDAPSAMRFLVEALGFEAVTDYRSPDGAVVHADLRRGPSVVGVSSRCSSPAGSPWAQVRQGVYLVVDDPDACYARARRAGADIAIPIADQSYGSRDFTLRAPEGHLWGFGTYAMSRGTGAPVIFPDIPYRDVEAAADWLERAIGFRRTVTVSGDDGTPVHMELSLGDGVVMIGRRTDGDAERAAQRTHLYVSDLDAHHARVTAAGATIVREPGTTPHGAGLCRARSRERALVDQRLPAKGPIRCDTAPLRLLTGPGTEGRAARKYHA